mgnify:CR=1 FL=1
MVHIDIEMQRLNKKLLEMWDIVEYQLASGKELLQADNDELTERVLKLGKKVNQYDVKLDSLCENLLALYTPVAVDLRQVLAILKINSNLERIGDTAEGIAYYAKKLNKPTNAQLTQELQLFEMYDEALSMFQASRKAFEQNDTALAKETIKRDKLLNQINRKANKVITDFIGQNPDQVSQCLHLHSIIKKLERSGDQVTNISEEIIFYKDAKVIKHKGKLKKKKKDQ